MILASTLLAFAEGGSLLSVDGSILVIFILFIALVPLVNRILVQPITGVLNERERLTEGTDTDVAVTLATIDTKLARYEEGVRGARAEGYKVLEGRRAAASAERQEVIDRARADAEQKVAGARETVQREAGEARKKLETDALEIARQISASVLGRAVGGKR